jgi:E3 ubiquitin-protein ligase RNF115/126
MFDELRRANDNSRNPPRMRSPFDDHDPWADVPDPEEGDISTFQFRTPGGGRGTFSFTSRTYISNNRSAPGSPRRAGGMGGMGPQIFPYDHMPSGFGNTNRMPDDPDGLRGQQPANLQDLFSVILQTMQNPNGFPNHPGAPFAAGVRAGDRNFAAGNRHPSPFDLLTAIFNPELAGRHGDAVFSQEAFDRILEQLGQQESNAPPPASEEAIRQLPKKEVDKSMLGEDGLAECSICMDNVELGTEVTSLPCNHWFHGDCVVAWLKEHDTCPHCRSPISSTQGDDNIASGSRTRPRSMSPGVRRSRTQQSSHRPDLSPPLTPPRWGSRANPVVIPESPTDVREARNRYYERSNSERDAVRRSTSPIRANQNQPEQYYGGRHESTDYYAGRPDASRRNSSYRRQSRQEQPRSPGGGGVTGWIRDHLPGGR